MAGYVACEHPEKLKRVKLCSLAELGRARQARQALKRLKLDKLEALAELANQKLSVGLVYELEPLESSRASSRLDEGREQLPTLLMRIYRLSPAFP